MGFEFEKNNTKDEYINSIKLKNQNNKIFYDKLSFIFIELPKYNKCEAELKTHFDKWLYFLKNLDSFDKIPDILKEDIFEEAFKVAEIAKFTKQELLEYENSLKIYRDNINVIETAKMEGREEGLKEGLKEGISKVAKKMLALGHSVEEIAEITGLTVNEIEVIKKL